MEDFFFTNTLHAFLHPVLPGVCTGVSAGYSSLPLPGEVSGDSSVCPYCVYYNQLGEHPDEQSEDPLHGNSCHIDNLYHNDSPCQCSSPQRSEPKISIWKCFWLRLRNKLELIVCSRYFSRGIMIAILINTLSMGIEYHEQHPAYGISTPVCMLGCVWVYADMYEEMGKLIRPPVLIKE
ncbi:PREDICTED: voltage-dependent T-type calcium channel subunit alpha-1I-like [Poecilia mexicana]|uniref:voltage-dependent T-type calcium channel subunit alpha-1I-like n=1 Tax=Poecilia mexicana TaxID=48701 RepID=UPI00072ED7DD|nr:PREDICTED: voltage-dependent T-type calcium channel subunit alpha-1I-like [Poecilia mexicana]